ncbi:calcium-activated chloride channel regulator 1-like isoform X2 [Dermacentor albipictus]|uniref:calcium-activated chloride channel regulator 1-like isoform X2 n=1 Tax=Dermacentor albipictus TaxID=60249 RepID=UPI0038FBFA60
MIFLGRVILTLALSQVFCNSNGLKIDKADGGYTDLLISINEDVPQNEAIVDNLKVLLQSSSEFLHLATGGRVFIKKVLLQFPKTWPLRPAAQSSSKCCFSKSDILVDAPKEGDEEDPFSTKLRRSCGKRGDVIRIASNVLRRLNYATVGYIAHAFVNEWSRYRYGVFYEHGRQGHKLFPQSYCVFGSQNGTLYEKPQQRWNACSERIMFYPDKQCVFANGCYVTEQCYVGVNQPSEGVVESSIMFMPPLGTIKHFCKSENGAHQHNKDAPNMHNKWCKKQSTWEVIIGNKDFMHLPPPNMSKTIRVEVEEIEQNAASSLSAVLVLDVSWSMLEYERLETLKKATHGMLLCLKDNLYHLAIVTFSWTATVLQPMVILNNRTRQGFHDAVDKMLANGTTCIGCGLLSALEILKNSTRTEPRRIVLLTDGGENESPSITEVKPQLLAAKVGVVTMAMGEEAEYVLEQLAAETNAESYFFPDNIETTSADYNPAINGQAQQFSSDRSGFIASYETAEDNGNETMADGDGETGPNHREFTPHVAAVEGDPGMPHLEGTNEFNILAHIFGSASTKCFHYPGYDSNMRMQMAFMDSLNLDISDSLPPIYPGTWMLQVESESNQADIINILVMSEARDHYSKPIVASCQMSEKEFSQPQDAVIFVDVSKGDNVVLDANVTAVVINGEGVRCPVRLWDDGNDPDIMENDGTYSGHFTQFNGAGRYSVMAYVYGNKSSHTYRRPGFPPDAIAMPPDSTRVPFSEERILRAPANYQFRDTLLGELKPTLPFERVTGSTSFKVTRDLQEADVPPGIIWDLKAVEGHVEADRTALVRLSWTWPGAHLTHGKATAVEIRAGTNEDQLERHFDRHAVMNNVVKGTLDPLPARLKQDVTIALPRNWATTSLSDRDFKLTAYIAARVINQDGLKSELSSTVSAKFNILNFTTKFPTTPAAATTLARAHTVSEPARTTITRAKVEPAAEPGPTTATDGEDPSNNEEQSIFVWILLAILGGLLMIIIMVSLLLTVKSRSTAEDETTIMKTVTTTM